MKAVARARCTEPIPLGASLGDSYGAPGIPVARHEGLDIGDTSVFCLYWCLFIWYSIHLFTYRAAIIHLNIQVGRFSSSSRNAPVKTVEAWLLPGLTCPWWEVVLPKPSTLHRDVPEQQLTKATFSDEGRRKVNRQVRFGAYLNPSRPPSSRFLLFPFSSFFFIMHSHCEPTKDPRGNFTAIFHHTTANMSIPLENLRPVTTVTDDPDTTTLPDALHQGSRAPPDAHPPEQVNQAQSSQEVVRMPSPSLHGEEGPAGSQRKSISFMPSLVHVDLLASWSFLHAVDLPFSSPFLVIVVKLPSCIPSRQASFASSSSMVESSCPCPLRSSRGLFRLTPTGCFDHPRC